MASPTQWIGFFLCVGAVPAANWQLFEAFVVACMFPNLYFVNLFTPEVCVCLLSCVQLFATPSTVAHQAPLSMRFPKQEYWSGSVISFSRESAPLHPRTEPGSPALELDSLLLSHQPCM